LLDPAFGYLIIGCVALLFASAGVHKLRALPMFAEIFAAYRVVPEAVARRLAWFIPCLELGVAAGLLWNPSRRISVAFAVAVLVAYAWGVGLNLLRGRRDLDCGCGTARDRRSIAAWMVWRNLFLAAALGMAALPWSDRPLNLTDVFTVVAGLAAAVVLYAAVDRLLGDVVPRALHLRSTS
jgi:hypothetical protein